VRAPLVVHEQRLLLFISCDLRWHNPSAACR
jgi:hypothetical protein